MSIIIPIFNTEKYVSTCLNSVLDQTYKNIEVLCINDGSTDSSAMEVKKFLGDKRVKLFSLPNSGVSVARNVGINNSSGDYILFLDSDDTIEPFAVESCINEVLKRKCDILAFGVYEVRGGVKSKRNDIELLKKSISRDVPLFETDEFFYNACGKFFLAEFIKKYCLRFPVGIKSCEDGIFCLEAASLKPKCYLLDEFLYNYVIDRPSSCMNKPSEELIRSDFEALKYLLKSDFFANVNESFKILMLNRMLPAIVANMSKIRRSNYIYHEKMRREIKIYLENSLEQSSLKKVRNFSYFTWLFWFKRFRRMLLDIRNSRDRLYKIITIFGFKFRIKRFHARQRGNR